MARALSWLCLGREERDSFPELTINSLFRPDGGSWGRSEQSEPRLTL